MADLITDIDAAYAVQVNPANAAAASSTPVSGLLQPPAIQSPEPVVILPPMSSSPTTTPTYPESVVMDATRAQQASSQHRVYKEAAAPYVASQELEPPVLQDDPGYLERLGLRSRDVVRLIVLAFMVALGISIHWVGSHYITEWLDSSDFNAKQRLAIRLLYPGAIVFVLWNIKAFQQ